MSVDPEYDRYKPDEFDRLAVLYRHAFGIGAGGVRQYIDGIGEGSFRVVRRGGLWSGPLPCSTWAIGSAESSCRVGQSPGSGSSRPSGGAAPPPA
jgi:hypothetical protein